MAKTSTSAQHYLECDNCEENPAKFLCKMCAGHLCEQCKSKHERKKITRNHEILPLTSTNQELLDLLMCPNHEKKKLECYCDRCSEPVCTECIIQSHNGHSVKSLTTVYKEFTDYSKRQKEEIENVIIPKYKKLLANEKEKRFVFTARADEIQKKIDEHTQRVVEMVKRTGQRTVESLRKAERDGLWEMDKFKDCIEKKLHELELISEELSANIEAKPQTSMLKSVHSHELDSFQTLPSTTDYTLTEFEPLNFDKDIRFGKPPVLERFEYKDCGKFFVSLI